jgi:hypothetical protein
MPINYKVVKKAQAGVKGGGEYRYHTTNLVLPNALLGPIFALCEKIKKPVRLLTDTAKKRSTWPLNYGR